MAPGQVGHDHDRALEHADEQQVPARVVGVDLGGELADPGLQRSAGISTFLRSAPCQSRPTVSLRLVGPRPSPAVCRAVRRSSLPHAAWPGLRPGRSAQRCPCQRGDQGVERIDVPGGERPGRAARLDRRVPQHAGPDRCGSAASQPASQPPVRRRAAAAACGGGQVVEHLGVGPQLVGGAGQRLGHPRAERRLQRGQRLVADPGPGEPGSALCGSSQGKHEGGIAASGCRSACCPGACRPILTRAESAATLTIWPAAFTRLDIASPSSPRATSRTGTKGSSSTSSASCRRRHRTD